MPDSLDQTTSTGLEHQIEPEVPTTSEDSQDGRIDRLVSETKTLTDDLADWINLKVHLIQLDIEQRVNEELNSFVSSVIVLALALLSSFLILTAASYQIGIWIDNVPLGFFVVGVFAALLAMFVSGTKRSWSRRRIKVAKPETEVPARSQDKENA